MDLSGEQQLEGTPEQIWDILQDPDVLVAIMPGCKELIQEGEDQYKGVIKAKMGPVSSTYNAGFKIEDKNPPSDYRLLIDGHGPAGFVRSDVKIQLKGNSEGTMLNYSGTAQIGGKIASLGQHLVESGAKIIISQGIKALTKEVSKKYHSHK